MNYLVSTFYALTPLRDEQIQEMRSTLQEWPRGTPPLLGMVLVAPDGINATIAGSPQSVSQLEQWLSQRLPMSAIKHSHSPIPPFGRWKVVRRRETVTSGVVGQSGGDARRLSPAEWHAMLEQENVLLIDVRNDYEIRLGRFRGAVDPGTSTFTQFADFVAGLKVAKDQKILTYCTGGIRCEKAAPYLKAQGFEQVFQLDGGILHYMQHYPDGFFEGECFVFDERVSLDQQLQPTTRYRRCALCGQPGEDPCHYCP
ncbi:hypothetical protein IV102_01920 [bacterium]|nr:hypothetical protein [bacterium]